MGGFGSGGHRAGAGRKPKPRHLRGIDGGAGRRGGGEAGDPVDQVEPPSAASTPGAIDPPAILTPAELAVWWQWAPQAVAAGTLTTITLHAFVHLCQLQVECAELLARFRPQVDANGEPRPLLRMTAKEEMATRRLWNNLSKDIHQRMKDFKLAPFGKEVGAPGAGASPADPLDAFMRGA